MPELDPELEEVIDAFLKYVNGNTSNADDRDLAQRCLSTSAQLIADYIGTATVPDPLLDEATREVAAELWYRRQAPGGVAQFAGLDGTTVRMARDPMVAAYPILQRYVVGVG